MRLHLVTLDENPAPVDEIDETAVIALVATHAVCLLVGVIVGFGVASALYLASIEETKANETETTTSTP